MNSAPVMTVPAPTGTTTSPDNGFLSITDLSVGYSGAPVLRGIDLRVEKGEFIALLGASGCGKSTLLRAIAGFMPPLGGHVRVGGRDLTRLPPDKRGMALVFQSYALWPHMSVAQNIGYGLKLARLPRAEIAERVDQMLALLGLEGLGERKPGALSGGQRQRVALGRALAVEPDILLLDEPLSNLDARIRLTVRHEISALQRRLGITAIHVTHDREEAMVMADRIVILNAGGIAQAGTPEEVYNRPVSPFVAAFMGAENRLPVVLTESGGGFAVLPDDICAGGRLSADGRSVAPGPVDVHFRAEAVRLTDADVDPDTAGLHFKGRVVQVSYPGGQYRHLIAVGDQTVVADAPRAFPLDTKVLIGVPDAAAYVFPKP